MASAMIRTMPSATPPAPMTVDARRPLRAPSQATTRPATIAAAPAPASSRSSPRKAIPAGMAASDTTTNGVAVPANPRRSSKWADTR